MAGLFPPIQHPASAAVGSPLGKADVPVLVRRLKEAGIPVETSPRRLAEYSYDASNYRVPPVAVLYPRSVADVVTALEACRETSTPVVPRGGGTSMAGNAIGPGLVIDFSRYMARILAIDEQAGMADVEPGVVLSELSKTVEKATGQRLTFAP